MWLARENGTLAASTYERSLEIVGWHQHEIGATGPDKEFPAEVLDICPMNFQGLDLIVAVTRRVIDGYGAARLLTFDRDPVTREPTVEVAHEALIREWPRLRSWLDDDRHMVLVVTDRRERMLVEWMSRFPILISMSLRCRARFQ